MTGPHVDVIRGDGPVVLGIPHASVALPDHVGAELNADGRALRDTDWHVDELFEGLLPDATVVRASFHRYAIDANRDPSGQSLYPGQATTELCPLTDFDGRAIHLPGAEPAAAEVARRLETLHAPYHAALADALGRARDQHGVALLYDCHSIRSEVPRLFEGQLPALNIGTDGGRTCAPELEAVAVRIAAASDYSSVLNGRFRGGWSVRRHGRPAEGIHAIQMEIAQRTYLAAEAPPWAFDAAKAAPLRAALSEMLRALEAAALELADR